MVTWAPQRVVLLVLLFMYETCQNLAEDTTQFHSTLSAIERQHYFGDSEKVPEYEIVDINRRHVRREAGSKQARTSGEIDYWFEAFDEPYHLRLRRNEDLIAPGCLVHHVGENGTRLVRPCLDGDTNPNCFYLGTSLNNRTARASVSTCNGLKGVITTDNRNLFIHPLFPRHAGRFKRDSGLRAPHIVVDDRQGSACQVPRNAQRYTQTPHQRPFDPQVPRHLELLVVADYLMYYRFQSELELYVHTVINSAAGTFVDESFGAKLYLSIVKLVLLETKVKGLSVVVDATETLRGFCSWQESVYGTGAESLGLQYDAAVLITRSDLVYDGLKTTSGLAFNNGMCHQRERCVIARDSGLQVGLTLAHELGHTLGMDHDGDGNDCETQKYMMGSNGGIGETAMVWSKCSVKAYETFISITGSDCLADTPHPDAWRPPKDKPGSFYNGNEQCGFYQGPSSTWCNSTEITKGDPCRRLVCYDPGNMAMCIASRAPMLDGTECGKGKWCSRGSCTEYGEDGPRAINGSWSTWPSKWSPCTRTCGGGVKIKKRYCNNPKPLYGGYQCQGKDLMAEICNVQPCEVTQKQFREEQCAETNTEPLNGLYYDWIPDKRRETNQQCQMYCKGRLQRTVHRRRPNFKDGTECQGYKVDSLYRCISGKCEEFGCDGMYNSGKTYDGCGICQGYDETCHRVTGMWSFGSVKEYFEFLDVQEGSTGITIKNENMFTHMALKINGTFLINGKGGKTSKGGRYKSDGVLASYDAGTPEIIKIARTLPMNITLLVWRSYGDEYDGVNPEITYEYHIDDPDAPRPDYVWQLLWSECSRSCGFGRRTSISICIDSKGNETTGRVDDSFCDFLQKPNQQTQDCNMFPCPPRWDAIRQTTCSKTCGGGTRQREFRCICYSSVAIEIVNETLCSHIGKPPEVVECNMFECPGVWLHGNWSECSNDCGIGNMTRDVACHRQEEPDEVSESECVSWIKPTTCAYCFDGPCTEGTCKNRAMGCNKYGWEVCHKYQDWAQLYCSLYCGYCSEDEVDEPCLDLSPSTCKTFDKATCEAFPEYSMVYCRLHCNMCNSSLEDFANKTKEEGKEISQVNCKDLQKCVGMDQRTCNSNKTWSIKECPKTCDFCWENAVLQMMEAEECQDKVNCHKYAPSMCTEYESWARKNCKRHCGFCKNQIIIATTTAIPCQDAVDCGDYRDTVCTDFEGWASQNCRLSCGFCDPGAAVPTQATTQTPCLDKADCQVYGTEVCKTHPEWSAQNCARYCHICSAEEVLQTTQPPPQECADKVDCTLYESTVCDAYKEWAKDNCGHFCGFCKVESGCIDKVDCSSYDANVCSEYKQWAGINCPQFCEFCDEEKKPEPHCVDQIGSCAEYRIEDCGKFPKWAANNCMKYCGLCVEATVAPTVESCLDVEVCDTLGQSVCVDYEQWSQLNCRKYCGFCVEPTRKDEFKECVDLKDCPRFSLDICQAEEFETWIGHNCQRYCKLCTVAVQKSGCDVIYYTSQGNFSLTEGRCTKTISARLSQSLALKLPPISVDCDAGEVIRLRHGKETREFCGNLTKIPIQVHAHEIDVEIMLNGQPEPNMVEWTSRGKGKWENKDCSTKSTDALQGHVTSPRYPNRYQPNTNCTTFITVHPGKKVALTFFHFDIELHSRCKCDYLIVTDVWTKKTTNRLCGKKEKFTWTSDSSHIVIQFISDDSDNWLGYSASYAAID